MPTCSITDDIIIDKPETVERLVDILEEDERNGYENDKLRKNKANVGGEVCKNV